ncbi:PAS domain S-box protein [Pseudomonas sp. MAG002Y]|uniref:PAS domain S-box protein n=1 Tax=Pseudomonas sp. MAG002Y TaxID=2678690 RepID=UPI001C60A147|nr:PAS domain S-box protein [Pseudomonas sp. MAG002Y]
MMGKQSCLVGGGQAGERLRAVDWQNTPLGPVEGWPLSLQAAIRIVLSSDFPMMVHWGPDLITFYNDAYAPSLGNKHPGNLGRPAKEWWFEMWDQLTPIFDHVLSGKAYFVEDARYTPNRNGVQQEAFFTHCHSPLWDDDGHVAGIFLVVTETTGRIVAERKLLQANADLERQVLAAKSSEARLSAFVSASSEGLYSMSGDWQEMHELKGRGFLKDTSSPNPNWLTDYIPVDEQPRVKATFNEAITSRKLFSLEHQVKRVDGSIGWVQSRAIPFLDAAGDITEWFGAVSDITVRRHADEVLQGQKKNLEHQVTERTIELNHLWEISPDLLLVIDYEGIFRKVNPAWTRILGYEPEELLGQNVSELVIPDTALSPLEAYERAARGELSEMENRYRHKDGSTRWFSWVAAPSAGQIYATGRDITAAKAAEAELASMQEALRHAQKMEAVGQLTGGVAHDFNNLLAGISGSVDMMQIRIQQGRLNDLERYLGMAQNGLKRAASLTHRLLAFSRRQTLDPKPTRIGQLVLGMQELIQSTVGPATPVRMNTPEELWSALVDAPQLENSLLNLCINARDAMPQGGRILVEMANHSLDEYAARQHDLPPGDYLTLSVTDSGTGMPPTVIERAFEPFFTTKPIGKGTGLGLSMVYGFVQQSGGQVRINSRLGEGTTVCVYLPRYYGNAITPLTGFAEATEFPRSEPGETVLVVDDEPTVRTLIMEILEDLGYIALEAGDGAASLEILHSDRRIDLLITDVGLPGGLNGRQVADAARVWRPGLKVLFITGYAEKSLLSEGQMEPGMAVLTKPFAMDIMATRIRTMIES